MTDPKITDKEPVRNPDKELDAKFDWAAKRKWSREAQRKQFRYPEDTDQPTNEGG